MNDTQGAVYLQTNHAERVPQASVAWIATERLLQAGQRELHLSPARRAETSLAHPARIPRRRSSSTVVSL